MDQANGARTMTPATYECWGGPLDGQKLPAGSAGYEELPRFRLDTPCLIDGAWALRTVRGHYELSGGQYVWREEGA
jgi:hypothetical protein